MVEKIRKSLPEGEVVLLTINDDKNTEKISDAIARVNTSLPVLLDKGSNTVSAYRAYSLPTLYLIDQQQKVFKVWTGSVSGREHEVIDSINSLLEPHAP